MNDDRFIRFQHSIDPALLEEAYAPKKKISYLKGTLSIAACFILILISVQNTRSSKLMEETSDIMTVATSASSASTFMAKTYSNSDSVIEEEINESEPAEMVLFDAPLDADTDNIILFPNNIELLEYNYLSNNGNEIIKYQILIDSIPATIFSSNAAIDTIMDLCNVTQSEKSETAEINNSEILFFDNSQNSVMIWQNGLSFSLVTPKTISKEISLDIIQYILINN